MYYYPFDSEMKGTDEVTGLPLLDRAQHGYQLQDFFSKMFNSGIMPNIEKCFQVEPGSGMSILVNPGVCFVAGAIGIEPSLRTLVVQAAESQDRIDAVVIRKNNNRAVRSVDLYVKKGTPNSNPKPPTLQRDTKLNNASGVYEIALAYLYVTKGTNNIPTHRITDKRYDNTVCGVSSPYGKVDTTDIFAQFEAEWELFKGQLESDPAANLQNQITTLSKRVDGVDAKAQKGSDFANKNEPKEYTAQDFNFLPIYIIEGFQCIKVGRLVSFSFSARTKPGTIVNADAVYSLSNAIPVELRPKFVYNLHAIGCNQSFGSPATAHVFIDSKGIIKWSTAKKSDYYEFGGTWVTGK